MKLISRREVLKENEKVYFLAATLRPETMYGQTNCWLHPTIEYAVVRSKRFSSLFILTHRAALNMAYQVEQCCLCTLTLLCLTTNNCFSGPLKHSFEGDYWSRTITQNNSIGLCNLLVHWWRVEGKRYYFTHCQDLLDPEQPGSVDVLTTLTGEELFGLRLKAPLSVYKDGVYTLPMLSITSTKGTGVVTSVPSDSPDDFTTLRDLKNKKVCVYLALIIFLPLSLNKDAYTSLLNYKCSLIKCQNFVP